ncbi:hypothetical protein RFI_08677, partial [Reticulomyxa filosa]
MKDDFFFFLDVNDNNNNDNEIKKNMKEIWKYSLSDVWYVGLLAIGAVACYWTIQPKKLASVSTAQWNSSMRQPVSIRIRDILFLMLLSFSTSFALFLFTILAQKKKD